MIVLIFPFGHLCYTRSGRAREINRSEFSLCMQLRPVQCPGKSTPTYKRE